MSSETIYIWTVVSADPILHIAESLVFFHQTKNVRVDPVHSLICLTFMPVKKLVLID